MSALFKEERISLNALARQERVHLSTCWRWCLRGVKGHILESFAIGGKRYTTVAAFDRWLAKINATTAVPIPGPSRENAIDAAERELEEILADF